MMICLSNFIYILTFLWIVDEVPVAFSPAMDADTFEERYGFQRPTTGDGPSTVIVYCRSGYRSGIAQKLMAEYYRQNAGADAAIRVVNYTGSWLDWSASGQPS